MQHANQFMIAMSQFGDQSLYRAHVIILTRDLFKQLGKRRLTTLIRQTSLHGTNVFHQLTHLTKIDFLLAVFAEAEFLDQTVLQQAICQADINNATPFHYACYNRNKTFLEFICGHAEQYKYLPALQETGALTTKSQGHNVLHLCSMPRSNDADIANEMMKFVITLYGPAAENLASVRNQTGLTPLALCCLRFDTKLITTWHQRFTRVKQNVGRLKI